FFLFYYLLRPPLSPLFPYTTLFRSRDRIRLPQGTPTLGVLAADHVDGAVVDLRQQPRADTPARGVIRRSRPPHRQEHFLNHLFGDRKSTRLNSSHVAISYAVFCLKK